MAGTAQRCKTDDAVLFFSMMIPNKIEDEILLPTSVDSKAVGGESNELELS